MYRNYKREMEYAFARAARTPRAFFMSHHPVLGFAANPGKPADAVSRATRACNRCCRRCIRRVLVPANVEALLSGHNHMFEIVSFATPHPPQFITGNGGDWLDEPFPGAVSARPAAGARRRGRRTRRRQRASAS